MRILISSFTYYPDNNGVSIVTRYIAEGLACNNCVKVITERRGRRQASEIYENVEIERIEVKKGRFNKWEGDREEYIREIYEFKPDCIIIVCTQTWTYDWIVEELDNIKCVKVLYTHGYSTYQEHYPIFRMLIKRQLSAALDLYLWKRYYDKAYKDIQKFDLVTYLSENNSSALYAKRYGLNNGIILYNAVDEELFQISHNDSDKYTFLCVSNFDDNKNQKQLIKCFHDINEPDSKLILVGNERPGESYLQECKQLHQQLNENAYADIVFVSGVVRSDIYSYFANADAFVFASKSEQYPMVVCEAAAAQLPIISSNTGHAHELPGSTIYKTDSELVQAMRKLLHSADIGRHCGLLNREYAMNKYRIREKIDTIEKKIYELKDR